MFGKTFVYCCVVVGTDEHHCDPACFSGNNRSIISWGGGEAHTREKLCCCWKICHRYNNMVNAACDSVEFAALCIASKFYWR